MQYPDGVDLRTVKPRPPVVVGQRWGKWQLTANLTLVFDRWKYEIDLERIDMCAEMLDWIFQLAPKRFISNADLGHFVRALNEIFCPQHNLCGMGREHPFNAAEYLRRLLKCKQAKTP